MIRFFHSRKQNLVRIPKGGSHETESSFVRHHLCCGHFCPVHGYFGPNRQDRPQHPADWRHSQGRRGLQVRGPDVAFRRERRRRPRGRGQETQGGAGHRGQRVQGRVRGEGQYQADHRGRSAGHRRAAVLQAGGSRGRGGPGPGNADDQSVVDQPQHHQGPSVRVPRAVPRSVPGAGSGELHHQRVQVHQGRGSLRRGQ